MIAIGTSGFRYAGWKGVFYPETLKPKDYLSYYAGQFPAVEINATYDGIQKSSVFAGMIAATPAQFEFIVKANRATTHELRDDAVNREFLDSLAPLREAGRLSGILAQFPWKFRNGERSRKYLAELRDSYGDIPLFIKFRHNSWNRGELFAYLEGLKLHFVSVDEPQIGDMMPPIARATSGIGYIRFHGRNAKTWWGAEGDRYDYLYSGQELDEWAGRVEELEKTVWKLYAFFNNCHQGYAARNAIQFRDLLRKKGIAV